MPAKLRDSSDVSRRSLMVGASVAPSLGAFGVSGAQDLAALCADWLTLNLEIDQLSLQWARLEASAIRSARIDQLLPQAMPQQVEMQEVALRLSRLCDERDRCLNALSERPACTLHEVSCKLTVAAHRMADEGGPEHVIVADAVRAITGLRRLLGATDHTSLMFSQAAG